MTVKLGIFGANGRMGRVLVEAISQDEDTQLTAAIVRPNSSVKGIDVGELAGIGKNAVITSSKESVDPNAIDVMIDFTLPETLESNLAWCVENKKAVVIGTTGLNQVQKKAIDAAAQHIPVLFSANMSVGVNLLFNLARQTARVMGHSADIEIWEAHHRFKKDAPSGTAMALGEVIADELNRDLDECAVYGREGDTGERSQETIGFATIRAGDVVGEHTVWFADIGERIELTHKASSRLTFAFGAVRAAKWLAGKNKGKYDMLDALGLK
ncbi:4-hydroxy-tetrahydrodipicolinate reductase [Alteromonas sp. a30]|uniref:4-hydroxy-tetrahydrodipicolinate reductase n=1 Tax=Alteromonas sp. a30 TaxID=2730917 RepID=UPI00227E9073|nr:4-hydroxy-tetrahydrodipicolinate reductase [Alteromonas sp. a30]MCY7295797.1 4-hydroxy-tetrahydrodipicolinate reductase [Alteromonas sp. a30]